MKLRKATAGALLAAIALCMAAQSAAAAELDLAAHQGKVIVVDFWASWCVPCRRSFPWLNSMQARYATDGLVIIGVNVDREREAADDFLRHIPADFEILFDSEATLAKEFGVQGMPSSFVIGRDGTIKARHLGFKVKRQDEYEAALVAALKEKE